MERLQLMLSRATNPSNDDVDILALDSFANIIRSNENSFALPATKLLVEKIHSSNTREALLALELLEGCMDYCGHRFIVEVGKFKFLNELIKLVSKKHLGDKTPKEIQTKILDILFTWTTEYPEETKIKEAYDMLKAQGIVHEPTKNVMFSGSAAVTRNFNKTELDPRQSMLKKLINSKNKDDIARANLLIQNMCREDERRMQIKERRVTEYKKACESVALLNEMLDNYDRQDASSEDLAIINELFDTCDLFQPTLIKLINEIDKDDELLAKILEAKDNLVATLEKYRLKIVLGETVNSIPTTSTLLEDILHLEPVEASASATTVLDELGDIFSATSAEPINLPQPMSSTVLEPQKTQQVAKKPDLKEKFQVLANLSKEKSPTLPLQPTVPLRSLDLDSLVLGMKSKLMLETNGKEEQKIEEKTSEDEEILDAFEADKEKEKTVIQLQQQLIHMETKVSSSSIKSLAEINLRLEELKPSTFPPRIVHDELQGLKISLNFVKDRPREDVLVCVISTINQGPITVKNFQFDASVPKPCKLRLLPPSATEILGVKLFQPPSGVFQILLVANSTQNPVKITCIFSYCLDSDPDPIKECIEVNDLPYKTE